MKKLFADIRVQIDTENLVRRTKELCELEKRQTTEAWKISAEYVDREMKALGIPNAEIVEFPADGKTVYQDKRMPLGWRISYGKLILGDSDKTVAADYQRHPFHVIKGTTATRKGGEKVRIITEQQFLAGENPENSLVMLEPETWPRARVLKPILDQGARGIITDFLQGRFETPDNLQWVNACSEGGNWHVQCEDRDFLGFSVTPRMGEKIRTLANSGELYGWAESDGERFEGKIYVNTALIPGRRQEEIWLLAHNNEPLLDDDSNGISAGIEIARLLRKAGSYEYSLRLVFAPELYGYAAYQDQFQGKVIGAANLDALPVNNRCSLQLIPALDACPFHGCEILPEMYQVLKDVFPMQMAKPACFDDLFMGEPTVGIPTVWLMECGSHFWHNSAQCAEDYIDPEIFATTTALAAVWFYKALTYIGSQPKPRKFTIRSISTPWRDYAEQFIFSRCMRGFPHDLTKVPKEKRIPLPDGIIYGPFGSIMAFMDGKRTVAELIQIAEQEQQTPIRIAEEDKQVRIDDSKVKKYLDALNFLADWGYLNVVRRPAITRKSLGEAIRGLGVRPGDLLLVHASVSKCGYVEGGADTVIQAVKDAVGKTGTALFPTFTRPFIYLGDKLNRGWNYRPFDLDDPYQVWTGNVSIALLEHFSDIKRSRHVSHSWAGFGPRAEQCLVAHGKTDPPASVNSPMGKALELGGKILYLGTGLAPTTFLHFLEDEADVPFLSPAVCRIKEKDGSLSTVLIEKHLPGHRDFYRKDAENCKFYQKAIAAGLKVNSLSLMMGKIQMIDLQELHRIGSQLLKADPRILLCDDPDCFFCRRF